MNRIYLILLLATSLLAKDSIEAIGYGNTENEALKSAYKNAVEEYVGVLVDTKVVIKNSKLIENKILTFSNGYIDSYKKISSKEQMGLWEVKINAIIKEQLIAKKMDMLKIPPKKIENSEQIYAKLATQIKTKFDAEDMLVAFTKKIGTVEIYKELVKPKINSFELDIDGATRTQVEGIIEYSYTFNYKKYEEIANEFESLLKAIGGKKVKTYSTSWKYIPDYFYAYRINGFREDYVHKYNDEKFVSNKIAVGHLNKQNEIVVNLWIFPKSYKMIYPMKLAYFNTMEENNNGYLAANWLADIISMHYFDVNVEIKDNKSKTIWNQKDELVSGKLGIFNGIGTYTFGYAAGRNIVPLLIPPYFNKTDKKYKKYVKLNINKIKNLKQVTIQLNYSRSKDWYY